MVYLLGDPTASGRPAPARPASPGRPARPRTRVVHVTEVYGGVETYLQLMLDHWRDEAVEFVFVLGAEVPFADRLREAGHEVRIVSMPRTASRVGELRAVPRLRKVLAELEPDVVHLHSSQAGAIGRLAWRGRGRVLYTPHAYFYLGQTGLRRWLFRTVEQVLELLAPSTLVATSPSEARRAVDDIGVPPGSVTTVTNGVEGGSVRRRIPGMPLRVGTAARFCHQKDLDMFLRVVGRLRETLGDDVVCDLVGRGHHDGDAYYLDQAIARWDLGPDDLVVRSWMPRPELREWLGRCDLVVLTSRYESFGYLLAEANALGIPVLGTDVDGIRDVIVPGENGHLVPSGDDAAMAEHVRRLAGDPDAYRALSEGAHAAVQHRLSIGRVTAELAAVYRQGAAVPVPVDPQPQEQQAS